MRKAAFRACLVCLCILLPFSFSFIASADFIGAIPPLYTYQWGTNYDWSTFPYRTGLDATMGNVTMNLDDSMLWGSDSNSIPPTLTRYQLWDDTGSGIWQLSISFTSSSGGKFFDLSSNGYTQFWFPFAVKGEDASYYPDVSFKFFGNASNDYEYVYLQPSYMLPMAASSSSQFRGAYWSQVGITLSSGVLQSSNVNRILVQIAFNEDDDVTDVDLWLGSLNVRQFSSSGASEDGPDDEGNPAPPLGENDQEITDIEGSIQNSTTNINNNTNAGFNRVQDSIDDVNSNISDLNSDINGLNSDINSGFDDVNSNIDDVGQSINNRIDDMVNDDMGYQEPDNPDIDNGLSDGDSLLGSLNDSLDNFSEDLSNSENFFEESFGGSGLTNLSYFLDGIYGSIPVALVSCITAVVIFLVIRKVVGR